MKLIIKQNKLLILLFHLLGFCVNHAAGGTVSVWGWRCDRKQARFSNSYFNGSATGTASQTTSSKGTPSHKSDASNDALGMSWDTPGHGNSLEPKHYVPNFKWGNLLNVKWAAGISRPDTKESSQWHEGEEKVKSL